MTPRDIEDPPEEHSLGKGVCSSSGAGGFEHVGDALARALDSIARGIDPTLQQIEAAAMSEIAKIMGWPLDPKAQLIYWLAERLTPEDMKTFIVRGAGEHVAMLVPCEAVALIAALGLEAA